MEVRFHYNRLILNNNNNKGNKLRKFLIKRDGKNNNKNNKKEPGFNKESFKINKKNDLKKFLGQIKSKTK